MRRYTIIRPIGPFVGQLKWNRRLAADTQTPIGTLKNTSLSSVNFSTGASLIKDWGYIGASGGSYRSDYGIPGSPEGHISGVNIALDRQRYEGQMEYRFNRPWIDKVKLQTVYTSYQHQEVRVKRHARRGIRRANLQLLGDGTCVRQRHHGGLG